jgi:hypothetical protein
MLSRRAHGGHGAGGCQFRSPQLVRLMESPPCPMRGVLPSIFNNIDSWFGFTANARAGQFWSRIPINAQRLAAALNGKTGRDQQQGKRWEVADINAMRLSEGEQDYPFGNCGPSKRRSGLHGIRRSRTLPASESVCRGLPVGRVVGPADRSHRGSGATAAVSRAAQQSARETAIAGRQAVSHCTQRQLGEPR